MKFKLCCNSIIMSFSFTFCVYASPWIDTSDIYLRSDLQILSDVGVITVPINTYPLMWAGIGKDLKEVEPEKLSPLAQEAFSRVNFYFRSAVLNKGNTSIKFVGASKEARFQHFGSTYRDEGEIKISHEYTGDWFAYKLSTSANYRSANDNKLNFDDSYLAAVIGNWVLSAGTIEQWWGPSFDSSLHKSNNARPMPSLMITRNDAHGFDSPWLSWIGPWTATSGFSLMDDDRAKKNTILWGVRSSVRPIKQLEISGSWTMQFCGDDEQCGFKDFWNAFTGKTGCYDGSSSCDDPTAKMGNHMAGLDIRYSDIFHNIPIGLYYSRACEDSIGKYPWNITDCAVQMGTDTFFGNESQQYKLFFEYSDTLVDCKDKELPFNCVYEHDFYSSGLRYHKKSLGSTYESDANVYVLGLIAQYVNSHGFQAYLRYAELNKDGYTSKQTEWIPQNPKENMLMLELSYRLPLLKGMFNLGGNISHSSYPVSPLIKEAYTSNDASIYSSYEYKF